MEKHEPHPMYRRHRERFLAQLEGLDAAALIPTGSHKIRSHDTEYRFRPGSDFWYLTGFHEPDCVLVLVPNRDEGRVVLFLRERHREQEIWNGRRLGVEAAPAALGVDAAHPIEALWDELPGLLGGHRRLVYGAGIDADRDRRVEEVLTTLRRRAARGTNAPLERVDPAGTLHELRLFKDADEIELMRRAAAISVETHLEVMRAAAPGVGEHELDALFDYGFRRRGANGPAYNNIVAGGSNACILHYVENDRPLAAGDLLLVDAGAEWRNYASDVTRTYPVDGTFSAEQRALYDVVLGAQKAAVASLRPDTTPADTHAAALDVIVDGLVDLGLVKGSRDEILEEELYQPFFMHKTGHWLGIDVHDCGSYHLDGAPRLHEPGMVTTVEPGLYVAPDDESVEARWRGIGIRIEDDVLVTADGHEVLTAALPREADEVEAICQERSLQPAT